MPASMTPEAIARITAAATLADFHAAVTGSGILPDAARFIHLEMDITSRCNIRCVMCYHSFDEYAKSRAVLFSPEDFARLAPEVLPYAHTLTLSLGSEPTTSPHFAAILRAAAAHQVPSLTFFTNGTLLHDDLIATILDTNVTDICVSIDGATAATYEAVRRGASFAQVTGNVRRLTEAKRAQGRRLPRLRLDAVMMRRNVQELPALVDLAVALGMDAINFFHMVAYDGLGTEPQSLRAHQDLSDLWLGRALARAAETGLAVAAHPRLFAEERAAGTPPSAPYAPTPYCHYPFFHISLNSGGHLLPCPFAHGEGAYGTVGGATTVEAVWLGTRFSELRRRILAHDPPEMCRRCSFLASRHPDVEALFARRPALRQA
jgi:MoaA/NifB/PqqE/SkfB family radical SAM enzyme